MSRRARLQGTRHNAGSMLLEAIVKASGSFSEYRSCDGANVAEGKLNGEPVLAVLPSSFMNLNGRCTGALARRYGMDASQIVVLHDDLDLAVGRYKIKRGGSSGGHKGILSCEACLRSNEFWRIRVGIGRPADNELYSYTRRRTEHGPDYKLATQQLRYSRCIRPRPSVPTHIKHRNQGPGHSHSQLSRS